MKNYDTSLNPFFLFQIRQIVRSRICLVFLCLYTVAAAWLTCRELISSIGNPGVPYSGFGGALASHILTLLFYATSMPFLTVYGSIVTAAVMSGTAVDMYRVNHRCSPVERFWCNSFNAYMAAFFIILGGGTLFLLFYIIYLLGNSLAALFR
ncbi:MAG: hypothetical protein LBN39_01850 [Planctomycetaceae bacterium]|nr:hypothetical protein [Planctomycetaceae bacterium]